MNTATIHPSCEFATTAYVANNVTNCKTHHETAQPTQARALYAAACSERSRDRRYICAGSDLDGFHGAGDVTQIGQKRAGDGAAFLPDFIHIRGGVDGHCRHAFGRGRLAVPANEGT